MLHEWTSKSCMLNERNKKQQITFYMSLFIWDIQKEGIYRDRKQISGCLGKEGLTQGRKPDSVLVSCLQPLAVLSSTEVRKL